MNDIATRVQMYLKDNGSVNYSNFDARYLIFNNGNGPQMTWRVKDIPMPTMEQLDKYSNEDVKKYLKEKAKDEDVAYLQDHRMFKFVGLICKRIGISTKDLIDEFKNLD